MARITPRFRRGDPQRIRAQPQRARSPRASLSAAWVAGEISNLPVPPSGHLYFTLKDSARRYAASCSAAARSARLEPADGDAGGGARARHALRGARRFPAQSSSSCAAPGWARCTRLSLQPPRQARARRAVRCRRASGRCPSSRARIGMVTSPAGAALRDVLTTLRRRIPRIPVIVYPTPVQGEGAAAEIAAAIAAAVRRAECDVLILCRGGGSIEDLWAFNEESGGAGDRAPAAFRSSSASATKPTSRSPTSPPTCARRPRPPPPSWSARRATSCWRGSGSWPGGSGGPSGATSRTGCRPSTICRAGWFTPAPAGGAACAGRPALDAARAPSRAGSSASAGGSATSSSAAVGTRAPSRCSRCAPSARRAGRSGTERRLAERAVRIDALTRSLSHLDPRAVLERGYSIVRDEAGRIVRRSRGLPAATSSASRSPKAPRPRAWSGRSRVFRRAAGSDGAPESLLNSAALHRCSTTRSIRSRRKGAIAWAQSFNRSGARSSRVVVLVIVIIVRIARRREVRPRVVGVLHALAARHVRRDVDRPAVVLQLRADPVDAEDSRRAEAGHRAR